MNELLYKHRHLLLGGLFGIEKECVRVTADGHLALTPHPDTLGAKEYNPFITTDFSESQVEIITPPCPSILDALGFVETLYDVVTERIGDELLWPQSLPPMLPAEDDIPVARYDSDNQDSEQYRVMLGEVYSRHRQLISGIHFNISLDPVLIKKIHADSPEELSLERVNERIYLKMVRNFTRYRWLIVWLYGETPVAGDGFSLPSLVDGLWRPMGCDGGHSLSLRTGPDGYRNREPFHFNYDSVAQFTAQIDALVASERLSHPKELYTPVRIKLDDAGSISHLEVRILDLDPFTKSGVDANVLYFTHIMMLYALISDETTPFDELCQQRATQMQDDVSCRGRDGGSFFSGHIDDGVTISNHAQELLDDIYDTLSRFDIWKNELYDAQMRHSIALAKNYEKRKGVLLYEQIAKEGYIEFNLRKAAQYKKESIERGYQFHSAEDMELSTQLLLKSALARGVQFDIIDRKSNFVRLYNNSIEQYVQQATKTSLDNYASVLMMENKAVTKYALQRIGIQTPVGNLYSDALSAINDFDSKYSGMEIVVKPLTTNFGIGITILHTARQEAFEAAVAEAFSHDTSVIVEEFVDGKEYRFFVIGNRVEAILHRVPANVVGDGKLSISELIDIKNSDSLRGTGYRTPLEKISKGDFVQHYIGEQGYTLDSIIGDGEQVFLRENSNISTGGDSIDFTDEIDKSYFEIASRAAVGLKVAICGVDMIIKDIKEPASNINYSIIEMNFNPAIHIHCYPWQGVNRRLGDKLITALGF